MYFNVSVVIENTHLWRKIMIERGVRNVRPVTTNLLAIF
jgi:hypothetical protein